MGEKAAKRRRGRWGLAAVAVATIAAAGSTVEARAVAQENVFDTSPSLAIEAARTRLRLFVLDNPVSTDGGIASEQPECPLITPDAFANLATEVGAQRDADLQLQLDPWLARSTSDPELRPDSAIEGDVEGIPMVDCHTSRPADGLVTRPSLTAINLISGVTFDDVVRLYGLEGVLRARPAGVGGQQVGSCLASDETSVCVVLWSSRGLALRLTLEGPPDAVNTSTAGALLTAAVPTVIESLAVVIQPAPVCSAEAIAADTGVSLIAEPLCDDGWAFGTTVECPPVTTSSTALPFRASATTIENCGAVDVFNVEEEGWAYHGSVDISCTETLTGLGMTVVTASQVAPEACDGDDPTLSTGVIRPNTAGSRVAALQVALVNLGYVLPIDGRYGPLTEAAVVDYQVRNGLVVDGVAGRQTQTALGI